MRTRLLTPLLILALLSLAAPTLAAQQEEQPPRRGKIDQVEEDADGDDEDVPWALRLIWESGKLLYHLATFIANDKGPGQGYVDYPYADPRALEHFVLKDVVTHRGYSTLSGSYYADVGSTLTGYRVAWDRVRSVVSLNAEFDTFKEPTATDVDHLAMLRVGAAGLARLSHAAVFRSGLGVRVMVLDDGRAALGPELELGIQAFPLRPVAFDGTFRVAGLSGAGASWFGTALLEGSIGAGVLVGRVEARAGFRTLVIGSSTTLAGPTLGARIWF